MRPVPIAKPLSLAADCRLFIDEVGNGDLPGAARDDNVRYLSLTGVLTTAKLHEIAFEPAFRGLKREIFGDEGIIFHRRDIIHRHGAFGVLQDVYFSGTFNLGILSLIRDMPYLAITVTIDKRAHLERYCRWWFDPYHYCLQCLIERYVNWLSKKGLRGDVAIEPRGRKPDRKLDASFRRIFNKGTNVMRPAIVQAHLTSDTLVFIPKDLNVAAMQLCDLIAHPSYRSMKLEREGLPEPRDFGGMVTDILKEKRYARDPSSMAVNGWGRKWLP